MTTDTALTVMPRGETSLEPRTLEEGQKLAAAYAPSMLLPNHLRGKESDILVTLMFGRELGLGVMQSLNGIHVVEGKPSLSAQTAVALVKKHSTVCQYFMCIESSSVKAIYETQRVGEPRPVQFEFTIEDAKLAGLLDRANWKRYPRAMLRNRCALSLARDCYPDLISGLYDPDEIEDFKSTYTPPPSRLDVTARVIDAPSEPTATADVVPEVVREPVMATTTIQELLLLIAAASSLDELKKYHALVARLKPLSVAEFETARAAYVAKRTSLGGVAP